MKTGSVVLIVMHPGDTSPRDTPKRRREKRVKNDTVLTLNS